MKFTEENIRDIFSKHFKRLGNINLLKIHSGSMNFTCEVKAGQNTYILKAYPLSRSAVAGKEYAVLKEIKKRPLKAPKVHALGEYDGFSYIIYNRIPGEPLDFNLLTSENKRSVCSQIAHNIKQLFEVKFDRFGSLTENENTYSSWKDFLVYEVNTGMEDLKKVNLDIDFPVSYIKDFLLAYVNNYRESPYGLVWSDFNEDNILIADNQLTGFIDFEGCFYGDPQLSLGYLFAREGNSILFQSIRDEMWLFMKISDESIYFYALFRLLRISKYLIEPMPNGRERQPLFDHFRGIKEVLNRLSRSPL